MKDGLPKPRLSDRLSADMERMRAEHAVLTQEQLQTFRHDLKVTAESALAIIKTDMDGYLLRVRKNLLRQSANSVRTEWQAMIWPVLIACCLMISTSISTWGVLTWLTPTMGSMGIRSIERPEATYLVPTEPTTVLARCGLGDRTVDCLMIAKED